MYLNSKQGTRFFFDNNLPEIIEFLISVGAATSQAFTCVDTLEEIKRKDLVSIGELNAFISTSRHIETVQPSPYPGARDCRQYLQTGVCSYGLKCRFNHPPPTHIAPVLPQSVSRQNCKVTKGSCKYGSGCRFTHSMGGDGAEPIFILISQMQDYDREEQKQKKMKVENLRIDPTAQSGEGGIQAEHRLEIPENSNVNAQENLQEQADIERQNKQTEKKVQEKPRQLIDIARTRAHKIR
ncbi:unnamed protein product [Eruca vesicaria subsp. sativa]|uniref:C3H1-type domain-containing protein n=1 Tax=Eruca vesicaria subsp. sativa TaxID=29727 RepID=A0ABC8M2M4_ERUVS|nr:unnamed protein product [Eruca vesicaria subsp. sativa]